MSAFERMAASDVSILGEFEQVVLLSILRLGDDAYAVTVRDEIHRCTGRDVSRGSIYITLDRLETKGFLKSRLADPTPERGGRAKRYYALRPRAVEALRESRRALVALWRGLESVLA
jgi:DNA-binding PadR family transcriptional regulator